MKKLNTPQVFQSVLAFSVTLSLLTSCASKEEGSTVISYLPVAYKHTGSDTEWYYVNQNGEKLFEHSFDEGEPFPFVNGFAKVPEKDKEHGTVYYFIDEKGEKVTDEYLRAGAFADGLAPVVEANGSIKLINAQSEQVIDLKELNNEQVLKVMPFSEGMMAFQSEEQKWGFINTKGEVVITANYDAVSSFCNGYAVVKEINFEDGEVLLGHIKRDGSMLYELKDDYEFLDVFQEGFARFLEDGKWGFIDETGKEVIKSDYEKVTSFHNGFASFLEDGEWGTINTQGEVVVKEDYEHPLLFIGGVSNASKKEEYGYIDSEGKEVMEGEFSYALPNLFDGQFLVRDGDDWQFVNREGKALSTEEFDAVSTYVQLNANLLTGYIGDVPKLSLPVHLHSEVETDFFDVNAIADAVMNQLTQQSAFGFQKDTKPNDFQKVQEALASARQYTNRTYGWDRYLKNFFSVVDFNGHGIEKQLTKEAEITDVSASYSANVIQVKGWNNSNYYRRTPSGFELNPNAQLRNVRLTVLLEGKSRQRKNEVLKKVQERLEASPFDFEAEADEYYDGLTLTFTF